MLYPLSHFPFCECVYVCVHVHTVCTYVCVCMFTLCVHVCVWRLRLTLGVFLSRFHLIFETGCLTLIWGSWQVRELQGSICLCRWKCVPLSLAFTSLLELEPRPSWLCSKPAHSPPPPPPPHCYCFCCGWVLPAAHTAF